jgi:hypothetical protein
MRGSFFLHCPKKEKDTKVDLTVVTLKKDLMEQPPASTSAYNGNEHWYGHAAPELNALHIISSPPLAQTQTLTSSNLCFFFEFVHFLVANPPHL